MAEKIGNGKLVWCKREKNVSLAIFNNRARNKSPYGNISIVVLRGVYKRQCDMAIPEFQRLLRLIDEMPEIKVKEEKI